MKPSLLYQQIMTHKYLFIGFAILCTTTAYAADTCEQIEAPVEIVIEVTQEIEQEVIEIDPILIIQQEIDRDLHELFKRFFDKQDALTFYDFANKVIHLLKKQKHILDDQAQHAKCDELIKIFEKNRSSSSFAIWLPILLNKDLHSLMSHDTRTYIYSVPEHVKVQALIVRLRR